MRIPISIVSVFSRSVPFLLAAWFGLALPALSNPSGASGQSGDPTGIDRLTASAEAGEVSALIELGVAYRDGRRVEENNALALDLFRRAAESGDPRGQDHYGWMHFMELGTPRDYAEALKWFRKSAEQDFHQGQFNLGCFYASGLSVEQDYVTAAGWWEKAAANGSRHAPYKLALLYYYGWGVEQNDRKAFQLCQEAVGRGATSANLLLGLLYDQGRGTEKDEARADAAWKAAYAEEPPERTIDMFAWKDLCGKKPEPGTFAFVQLPHVRQGYNNCAPTAASICLSTHGSLTDPYVIKRGCPGSETGHGTDWALLVEALNGLGRRAELMTFPVTEAGFRDGLAFLKAQLDGGRPVLVDIKEPEIDSPSAHTVVAVGYDEKASSLIIHDPAVDFPGIRIVPYPRLDEIWRSRWYSPRSRAIARPVIRVEKAPSGSSLR